MKKYLIFMLLLANMFSLKAQDFSNFLLDIKNVGTPVNTEENDYAPFITNDGTILYYTSFKSQDNIGNSDLFFSKISNKLFQNPVNPGSVINTPNSDGSIYFAADGKTFVFATDGRPDGFGSTDIYIGELINGEYKNIKNLGKNVNSVNWETQPSITADGKIIYFVSDRSGGVGGTDIYYTKLNPDGEWSAAQNLGNNINTTKDERSPCITPDGFTLYFSSDGYPGYGKRDIFLSIFAQGTWNKPINLGKPVNSSDDELYFYAPGKGEYFYFASNRKGGSGEYDIYSGTPNIFGAGMTKLTIRVLDSLSKKPLPSLVNIIESPNLSPKNIVALTTDAQTYEYKYVLPAMRAYQIEAQVRDYDKKFITIPPSLPNTEQVVELLYGRIVEADFDLGKYEVPFFITGYYRINTPENLDGIYPLLDGYLKKANYIERFPKNSAKYTEYKNFSLTVESLLKGIMTAVVEDITPKFMKNALPNEELVISFYGFADPQPIRSNALYLENDTVRVNETSGGAFMIFPGEKLNNIKLSGLRAFYSAQYFDKMIENSNLKFKDDYLNLKANKRIKYEYVAGGESNDGSAMAAQRRIRILITRVAK